MTGIQRRIAVAITITQVALGMLAIWALWAAKASSVQFVSVHGGEPLRYNPSAILVPSVLMVLFGSAMVAAWRWKRAPHGRWVVDVCEGLAVVVIAAWWLALWQMNYNYYKLLAASGRLAPNEIMGSSWALMVVVFPFQLAALLGVILLLVSAFRARRAKTDQA
jgi:hypothetical protein